MTAVSPTRSFAEVDGPVFVIGGTGFLGHHLVSRLSEVGVQVRVLARELRRASFPGQASVEVFQGDFLSLEQMVQAAGQCKVLLSGLKAFAKRLEANLGKVFFL